MVLRSQNLRKVNYSSVFLWGNLGNEVCVCSWNEARIVCLLVRGEYWVLHHSAFQKPKVWHLLFFTNIHSPPFFFSLFLSSFQTYTLTVSMVQWLPDFKSGFKKQTSPHWIQDSPNFEAWRYPDQIKAWLLLMHNSNAFSHPFDWIFVLSWQRDNTVMHSWTTFPKQKANKKNPGSASTADSQTPGTNSNMKVSRRSILLRTL